MFEHPSVYLQSQATSPRWLLVDPQPSNLMPHHELWEDYGYTYTRSVTDTVDADTQTTNADTVDMDTQTTNADTIDMDTQTTNVDTAYHTSEVSTQTAKVN